MRRRPELMQFEIEISTIRYFPPSGTAGFDRSLVRGNRRVPAPPPIMTARVRSERDGGIMRRDDSMEIQSHDAPSRAPLSAGFCEKRGWRLFPQARRPVPAYECWRFGRHWKRSLVSRSLINYP